MKRRTFLRLAGAAAGLGATAGLYAWQLEPYWLEFVERDLPVQNLPATLSGKTLLQISDIHVGNRFDHRHIIDSFIKAKQYAADIVVYTGDYVSWEGPEQLAQLRETMAHAPLGTEATYAILGNHDYGKDWREEGVSDSIVAVLQQAGITVLRNETVTVNGLQIIGFDDLWGDNFDPARALVQWKVEEPGIVLCHNPDVCDLDVWRATGVGYWRGTPTAGSANLPSLIHRYYR